MAKRKATAASPKAPVAPANARSAPSAVMDLWDRASWTCLHLLVFLVPLAMSNFGPLSPNGIPLTYDQFDMVKVFLQRGLLLVAAAAWLIGLLLRGGRVRIPRTGWLVLGFVAWVALTTVLSVHWPTALFGKYRRFEGLISFVTYGVALFMTLQFADRPERMRSLARTLVIGGFVVAAYGAIQVVGATSPGVARIVLSVAAALTALIPLALGYLAFRRWSEDPEARLAYLVGAGIALVGGLFFVFGLARNIDNAVLQNLQSVSLDPVLWGRLGFESNRAFSTFGNPDLLGGYLIFPWAISLGLALSEKHALWRTTYWVFALLNVFVGITSYVRGAWIGATISLAVIVIAYLRARKGGTLRLTEVDWTFIGGTALLAVAVIVASMLNPHPVLNVGTRIASIFDFNAGSGAMRLQIWDATIKAIRQHPIFGWGADTTRLLFPMFKSAEYVRIAGYLSVADNVHNYPLQLASGIGIPGALMFYALIIWTLALSAKTALAKASDGRNLVLAGFWAAVIGYIVHLMFGLSVTGSTVLMWVCMGVLLAPSAKLHELAAPSWNKIAIAIVVLALGFGTYLNTRYIAADMHFLKGKVASDAVERLQEIDSAIALNPYNEIYQLGMGDAWRELFTMAVDQYTQSTSGGGAGDQDLRQRAIELHQRAADAYERVIRYAPLEYDSYVFLANLDNQAATYLDPAYTPQAVDAARQAVKVEKYGPAARVQLAMALLLEDKVDEAIKELEFATSLDPNYKQAFVMLAKAYGRAGRFDEARTALQHILQVYPDDPDATAALASIDASAAAAGQ